MWLDHCSKEDLMHVFFVLSFRLQNSEMQFSRMCVDIPDYKILSPDKILLYQGTHNEDEVICNIYGFFCWRCTCFRPHRKVIGNTCLLPLLVVGRGPMKSIPICFLRQYCWELVQDAALRMESKFLFVDHNDAPGYHIYFL